MVDYPRRPADREIHAWEIVDFTPLPAGWRNVFQERDGVVVTQSCPGVFHQRSNHYTECWDEPQGIIKRVRTEDEERWMFAAHVPNEGLYVADEVSNYLRTDGPGDEVG